MPAMNYIEKMRGTLEVVRDALITMSAHEDDIEFVRAWIDMTQKEVDSALAEPPRNCDRPEYATIDGMVSAHEEFCESWHDAGNSCARCPHNKESKLVTCREVWLMAPAEKGADE